jgi:hypothetical protein
MEYLNADKKIVTISILLIVSVFAFSLVSPALSKKPEYIADRQNNAQKVTRETESNIEVYWDAKATNTISYIDWGAIQPGKTNNLTIFVKNKGKTDVTLSYITSNWDSLEMEKQFQIYWNYTGQTLSFKEVIPIKLTLFLSENVKQVGTFQFDITIISQI